MHLSMLSPRVGEGVAGYPREIDSENLSLGMDFDTYSMFPQGQEFDMPAILEHRENLEIGYPQS